jgi:hypothetical protein
MKSIAKSIGMRSVVVGVGALLVTLASARSASAQEPPPPPPPATNSGGNGIGVGASAFLSGAAAVQVDYDTYAWDIEGMFSFADRDNGNNRTSRTDLEAGARGWFHLHHGASSDFSVGGGIGILHSSETGFSSTTTLIEPGVRARVFVTPNVAVHAVLGLSIVVGDNPGGGNATGIALLPQPLFGLGFTYFFR